jgi:hypothetical protein
MINILNHTREMCEEVWKPIEDYDQYFISNYGHLISFRKYKNGKILKPICKNHNYLQVNLYNHNKMKSINIHRLVAKEFIENSNPNILIEVNHIDENKENNHYLNLEWCSSQYNTEYSQSKNYKILFPNGHKKIIYNLRKFCRENNLNQGSMNQTFKNNYIYKGFKILERGV